MITIKGRVVSTKMNKTAVVLVESERKHPLYQKTYKRSKKYLADDNLKVNLGDIVEIEKIRPISKLKHWRVVRVLGKDMEEIVKEQLKMEAAETIGEVMPESSENSDNQKTRDSADQTSDISDKSDSAGTMSNSELSEKSKKRSKKGGKSLGSA